MITKSSPIRSYAKRYQNSPIPVKKPFGSNQLQLKNPLFQSKSTQPASKPNRSPKLKPLLTLIEAKSKDYENAIKDHLGIKHLSRDTSFSSIIKKVQKRQTENTPTVMKSLETPTIDLIEMEEAKLYESIKFLDTSKRKIVKKQSRTFKIVDEKDKEIQVLQNSLNKINLLLNKLLRKSPTRLK